MYIKLVEAIVDMREEAFAHVDTPMEPCALGY